MPRNRCLAGWPALLLVLFSLIICSSAIDLFGRKKLKRQAEIAAAQKAAEEAEAKKRANTIVIGGLEHKTEKVYGFVGAVAVILSSLVIQRLGSNDAKEGNNSSSKSTVDVVIVGCGLPRKGMGWYHLTQLLEMEKVNVLAVVEPFFLNGKLCKDVPPSFSELVKSLEEKGVQCVANVTDLKSFSRPTVCLIAGRTPDNPKLFRECMQKGPSVIYLEKPGAPSVSELEEMKTVAREKTMVYIGYNKNVTPYVQKAIQLSRQVKNSHVFFCHNNSYSQNDLPEVFSRNPEGMLKNMAIHELALLVTFFGVTVDSIDKLKVNTSQLFSEKISVWVPGTSMPNPKYISDFSRVAFRITTKSGANVSVMADRCGGNISFAVVKDEAGKEVQKFEFPDAETAKIVEESVKSDPEMMPYFFIQSNDYLELKNRVIASALEGKVAEGVATIDTGIEALKLAEYITNEMNKALDKY